MPLSNVYKEKVKVSHGLWKVNFMGIVDNLHGLICPVCHLKVEK